MSFAVRIARRHDNHPTPMFVIALQGNGHPKDLRISHLGLFYAGFFFCAFRGKLEFAQNSIFFPMKLDFSENSRNFLQNLIWRKKWMGWLFLCHFYHNKIIIGKPWKSYGFQQKSKCSYQKTKETLFQKWWNLFSKSWNSFSKRRTSLVPLFLQGLLMDFAQTKAWLVSLFKEQCC